MRRIMPRGTALLAAAAVTGLIACDDAVQGPTFGDQPAELGVDRHLNATADIDMPGGVSLEPFARGAFPHHADAQFKIRYGARTEVIRLEEASDIVSARLTIEEGGSAGWHRHPGIAIGIIQSGTFGVIEETDCVLRTYGPGETFFHRGQGILDVGFNAGEGEVVVYLTFLGVPPGEAPTAPQEEGAETPC